MLRRTRAENGELQGAACSNPRVTVYRGIPYAKPPVGELRWCTPQSADDWQGVRSAHAFAPIAWQTPPGSDPDGFYTREFNPCDAELAMSEDCLYLNIWTPARAADERLPVYVFIHGGGLEGGFSYSMDMNGEQMARQGIVFVTIGYRLNAFGFLAHAQFDAGPDQAVANFGLYDCRYALEWVQRNIRGFGGDPSRVTIGGQSAGALCVLAMMTSPLTNGLFARAITQSGGGLRACGYNVACVSKEEAFDNGTHFLEELGVKTVAEARALSGEAVYAAYQRFRGKGHRMGAVVDGRLLVEEPTEVMRRGANCDYLLGSNRGEVPGTPAASALPATMEVFRESARAIFGSQAGAFLDLCAVNGLEDALKLYRGDVFNTRTMAVRAYTACQAARKRSCYAYIFDADMPGGDHPGSYHGSELWYVFQSLNRCWRPFRGSHYDLARQISGYWVNFVKTGDPNGLDENGEVLPHWEAYAEEDPFVMEFTDWPRREARPLDALTAFRIRHHLEADQ